MTNVHCPTHDWDCFERRQQSQPQVVVVGLKGLEAKEGGTFVMLPHNANYKHFCRATYHCFGAPISHVHASSLQPRLILDDPAT